MHVVSKKLQETTTATIAWALGFLVQEPEVQAKVHAELERVVGGERLVTLADRPALPYLNAFFLVRNE